MRTDRLRSLLPRRQRPEPPTPPPAPVVEEVVDPGPPDGAEALLEAHPKLACRAPFTSIHVDQFGDARPCCQSSLVLGNVGQRTLEEIWTGEPLAELRAAIAEGDLSRGCEHCEWAGRRGREVTYATRFDRDRVPVDDGGPTRLELAPSNSCNLQCAMCNGDWSSSIRLHREGRPALPRVFGDRQLAEVAELAPGLDEIHLFGGEPLLMPEALRLLEIAAETDTRCVITTNGSVLTPRVEALLDRPGVDLVVSVDGTSAEVYEPIRQGASWSVLEEHLDRFIEIADRHQNTVDLAHCLMTANWHEFPDHLRWAADRLLAVYVNDVLSPVELSLHHLTPPELVVVIRSLRARQDEVYELPPSWRTTWDLALERLEQTLADGTSGERHPRLGQLSASTDDALGADDGDVDPDSLAHRLRARLHNPLASVALDLGPDLVVRGVHPEGDLGRFAIGDLEHLVGRRSAEVQSLLGGADRPDARAVRRWDREEAIEERRYDGPEGSVSERRTIHAGHDAVTLRFEYWLPPTEAEVQADLRAACRDGRFVTFEIDGTGTLVSIEPDDLAHELGLRTDVGISCLLPTDLLVPERADPPPDFTADEIEPGLVSVDLRWADGLHLVALARASTERTVVQLGRAAATAGATR
ncbi:MAG: radical SAM protein [Actinobacteria bacterium]|nr:radical SAM protein [Actinomycetota bacterium]